jgi:nucleotide-binding universal stress UspA family protein
MKPKPITRILAATDFSACADRALDYAAFLAGACSAPLDVLQIVEAPPDMDPNEAMAGPFFERCRKEAVEPLDRLVRRLTSGGVMATSRQRFGIPSQQINAAAGDLQADLVIVGAHGRTGLAHIPLGSTAERVVLGAPCPVLAVPAPHGGTAERGEAVALRQILCPVDFSRCSVEALEYAASMARTFGASLSILHVLEPIFFDLDLGLGAVPEYERARADTESRLADVRNALAQQGLAVQIIVSGGVLADSILAAAQANRCDAIVMGTHGRRGRPHLMTGSVAEAVLRRTPCPVWTVRSLTVSQQDRVIPTEVALDLSAQ